MIVEGALSGLHRATLHGSSVEFAEHKEYSPGDELRHVDWKAYAKVDRYYVKQFEQESQLTVYLVLDASASMAFAGGGIAKLEYARPVARGARVPRDPAAGQGRPGRVRRPRDRDAGAAARAHDAPPRSARRARQRDARRAASATSRRPPRSTRIAELARRRRALIVLASRSVRRRRRDADACSRRCARSATTSRCSTSSIRTSARSRTTA